MRFALAVLGLLWTAGAAALAWAVASSPPAVLDLGGRPLFAGSLAEVIVLGLAGAALLAGAAAGGRRGGWIAAAAGLALAGTLAREALPAGRPDAEPYAAAEGPPAAARTTLLVAVDGMTWEAALPLVRRGELPTIARLMEEGSYGVLHSLASRRSGRGALGYWSPVVWTSIATGVGPRRHGVDDFFVRREGGGRGLAATFDRRAAAFWNLFPAFGQRVAVVGWWASWPAETVDGYVASSHLGLRGFKRGGRYRGEVGPPRADLDRLTHPAELAAEIAPLAPAHEDAVEDFEERVYRFTSFPLDLGRKRDVLYAIGWQDRYYLEIARHLLRRDPVPLTAVYFEGVDSVSHHFWRYRESPEALPERLRRTFPAGFDDHQEAVDNYYRVIDGYLADLLAALPEDATVVLCSDHGFGADPDHGGGATHSPYGVLLARGPGIARGRALNLSLAGSAREAAGGRTGVLDLLPTLLYLHGLPVADDLEGEPIWRLFTREYLATHPLRRIASYGPFTPGAELAIEADAESDEEYERRLRGLGYID